MTYALILLALAAAGVYLLARAIRPVAMGRSIDLGAVSDGWIAEHRQEDSSR